MNEDLRQSAFDAIELEGQRSGKLFYDKVGIGEGPDENCLKVVFVPGEQTFHWWPRSGWWNRIGVKGQGRGLPHLFENAKLVPSKPKPPPEQVKHDWHKPIIIEPEQKPTEQSLVFLKGLGLGFAIGGSLKFFLDTLFQ
jgi:hypothetical protein